VRLADELQPQGDATLVIRRPDGSVQERSVTLRVDTAIEVSYLRHGGILPYVLRQLLAF
jgi:aconitate hydratase